jgi:hypothetical protein
MVTQSRFTLLSAGAILLASAAMAQATPVTIYQDKFPGSAANVLTGTSPATDTTGSVWTFNGNAGDDWAADGLAPTSTGGNYSYSIEYLPTTLATGQIYTLSATLTPTTGATGNWLGLGFFNSSALFNASTTGPWMLLTDTGQTQAFGGPGVGNQDSKATTTGNTLGETATVILNTSGAAWTYQWLYNGVALDTPQTYGTNPIAATGVGIISYQSMQGQVGSFQLTDSSVPEPATLGLMAAAGLGLMLLKRRQSV